MEVANVGANAPMGLNVGEYQDATLRKEWLGYVEPAGDYRPWVLFIPADGGKPVLWINEA